MPEDGRLAVDAAERVGAHVACGEGQEAAGEDFSRVGNKNKSFTVVQAAWGTANVVFHFRNGCARLRGAASPQGDLLLQDVSAVVLRLRGLDMKTGAV